MASLSAPAGSVASAMQAVRRLLSQNLNDEIAVLARDYTPGGTLTLRNAPRRFGQGSVLSWRDATLYVVENNDGTVQVIDGYDGSPEVAVPAGTPMRVNPRFTDFTLFELLCEQVEALNSPLNGLYGVVSERFSGLRTDDYYPIPVTPQGPSSDSILKVLSVRTSADDLNTWVECGSYTVTLNSGIPAMRIFADALNIEVVYATRFTRPTDYDTTLTSCGLPGSAVDIPVLGAAATLMQGQEARRVNQRAQGDPRRAEDVPITGATNSARELARRYGQRIDEEAARLIAKNPYRYGSMT